MHRFAALLALYGLVVSCASQDNYVSVAALETRAMVPASYQAELTGRGVKLSELSGLTTSVQSEEAEETQEDGPPGAEAYVEVSARLVAMNTNLAEGALGWARHAKQALRVDRSAAQAFLDELAADGHVKEINSPQIVVEGGSIGTVAVVNQVSYVRSFDLLATHSALAADPQIDIAEEGYQLVVQPQQPDADGFVALALELTSVTLERPIEVREANILGADIPVSFQLPVTTSQRLGASTHVGPEDVLVLGGLATADPDVFLFAFVSCKGFEQTD